MPAPTQLKFRWNKARPQAHVRAASRRALDGIEDVAHQVWDSVVPVGVDRKDHKAGTLKRSWFHRIVDREQSVWLIIGASAPYAYFVEVGTRFQPEPKSPLRKTAGTVTPLIETAINIEMRRSD
jgi:hypothetical protein